MRLRSFGFSAIAVALVLTASCSEVEKPVNAEEVTDFNILYSTNCSGCHGANGRNGPGRPLNDPVLLAILPQEELRGLITDGRPGTAMPAFGKTNGGPLSELQIDRLVAGIEQHWKKPVSFGGAAPPSYRADQTPGDTMNGRKLFAKDCFMCHGPAGKIGSIIEPAYLALASDQYLRTSIIVGRRDTGIMPTWRYLNLGKPLTDQEIIDLVSYLSSLRPSYSPLASSKSGDVTDPLQTTKQGVAK